MSSEREQRRSTEQAIDEEVRHTSTVRPLGDAEVYVQPDGTVEVYYSWAGNRLSLIVSHDGARQLTAELIAAELHQP